MNLTAPRDPGFYRRKYPRRHFHRRIGVLHQGRYHLGDAQEIGEGGLALDLPLAFAVGDEVVVNLKIPSGEFVSLRAEVRSVRAGPQAGQQIHGLSFKDVAFTHKRQIRAYVSSRSSGESLLI